MPKIKHDTRIPRYPYCIMQLSTLMFLMPNSLASRALVRITSWSASVRESTYEEDVKVGQGEPAKGEVERVVEELHHEHRLADERVVRVP